MIQRNFVIWISAGCAVLIVIVLINRGGGGDGNFNARPKISTDTNSLNLVSSSQSPMDERKSVRKPKSPEYSKLSSGNTSVTELVKIRSDLNLRPKFELMDDDGRLTTRAIESQNLTESEVTLIRKHCDDFQVAMRNLVKSNLVRLDELERDQVVEAYRMKPFAAEGEAAMSSFIANLSRVIGPERALELIKSVPVERLAGQFSVHEVIIKIKQPPSNMVPNKSVDSSSLAKLYVMQTETHDAESGALIQTSSGFIRNIDSAYFNVLSCE